MQHQERKHARLSASKAERFMTCPGSYRLESQMPEEPSGEAAARGTKLHELSEKMILDLPFNRADYTDEELRLAQSYADFIEDLVHNPRRKLIEVNVDEGLKTLHEALGGTADAVLVDGNHLHVCDAKFGRIPVNAEENLQLMTYSAGVMIKFKAPTDIPVTLHIFQPGVGHSYWTTTGERIMQHAQDLKAAAELAMTIDAPTNPSPQACKYCRAKTICPSMRSKVQDNARKDFAPDTTITPEMLDLAELASAWADAVKAAAKTQIKSTPIEGWTLKKGRKTRFWKAEGLAIEALKAYPQAFDLKSPSAIEKLGIDISEDLIGEKFAEDSLVRGKKSPDQN